MPELTNSVVVTDFGIAESDGKSVLSCRIRSDGFPDELRFEVRSFPTDTYVVQEPNWALAALLYPAMLTGRDLHIEADISQRLWTSAQGDLQDFLRACDPQLRRIRVSAGWAAVPPTRNDGSATGFSAGVDSFATLSLYAGDRVPESLRIRRLTVHDVGAFGAGERVQQDFLKACRRAEDFAGRMGLEMAFVQSNLDHLYRVCAPASIFPQTHSLRNAAAAHVLGDGVGCFLYSSAFSPLQIGVEKLRQDAHRYMAHVDPIILPLLSTERLRMVSAGAGLSRGEKTALVAGSPEAQRHLDVCVSAEGRERHGRNNCSRCWKCERTMATLEALGALDSFDAAFDLSWYHRNRRAIVRRLAYKGGRGSETDMEVVAMQKAAGLAVEALPTVAGRARAWAGRSVRKILRAG